MFDHAERSGHDVALRMHFGFSGSDPSFAHERFDQAVVFGELLEDIAGQTIHAAIADIDGTEGDAAVNLDESKRYDSRAHAMQIRVGSGLVEDLAVRVLDTPLPAHRVRET